MKVNGMTDQTSKADSSKRNALAAQDVMGSSFFELLDKIVVGSWYTDTAMYDYDAASLEETIYWAHRAYFWHHLGGYSVWQTSSKTRVNREGRRVINKWKTASYHVIFNEPVSPIKAAHVRCWVAQQSKNENLTRWCIMQDIKESATLRLGRKGCKGVPKLVAHYGRQDKQIKVFKEARKFVLDLIRKAKRLSKDAVHKACLGRYLDIRGAFKKCRKCSERLECISKYSLQVSELCRNLHEKSLEVTRK